MKPDWKRFNKDQYELDTKKAHEYIKRQLLEYLNAGKASTNDLHALITSLQALPEYQGLHDETNTPAIFALGKTSSAFAAAYYLYRGGSAIPEAIPAPTLRSISGNRTRLGKVSGQPLNRLKGRHSSFIACFLLGSKTNRGSS